MKPRGSSLARVVWLTLGWVGLCALLLGWASHAWAVKTVTWDRKPVAITLIVGVEQLVHFTEAATVGLPAALAQTDVFRHLFASDTAYWKAMRPFDKQRIKVRLNTSGQMLLFDVRAITRKRPPKAVEPISLIVPNRSAAAENDNEANSNAAASADPNTDPITMFDVLRYAVQTDYAPPRVVKPVRGLREIKTKIRGDLSALYAHGDAANLSMRVARQWAAQRYYVTAVKVSNRSVRPITIDPSRLQHTARHVGNGLSNQFIAAAALRRDLAPRGDGNQRDRTRIYLVTDRPFATVIKR